MRIELKNLSKAFDGHIVLKDIVFEEEFKSLSIIGPSGGGKSTLLRIIAGLIAPTEGEVYIDGNKLEYDEKSLRNYRRSIGFVFQSRGLFEHLTAAQNVTLPLIHTFGLSQSEAHTIADKLLERFGLLQQKNKYPFQLSGGEQQRIAIARAVGIKPKLLILDEPTSALDPEFTVEVLDMLGELQKDGLHTIVVTHEMGFAKYACEKVVFLANHRIIESGESIATFKSPQSQELKAFLNKILEWKV